MRRPQFTLKMMLWLMVLVAVGCLVLPRPLGAVRRWLWPPEVYPLGQIVSPRIEIIDEDEALLGVPPTP